MNEILSWRHYSSSETQISETQISETQVSETQISEVLEQLACVDATDIKCMLSNKYFCLELTNLIGKVYIGISTYYSECKGDLPMATKFCQSAISLAMLTGDTRRHSIALCSLAWIKWQLGDYSAAKLDAYESQRLARISGNFLNEASSLRIAAVCWHMLGNYRQSVSLSNRAMHLLRLCGISGGNFMLHAMLNSQAEAHKMKSEYVEAHNIHTQILHKHSTGQDLYLCGIATLNIAEIDITMASPKENIQEKIDAAKVIFTALRVHAPIMWCECVQADLNLREGDKSGANTLFCKSLTGSWGQQCDIVSYCLERLADLGRWNGHHSISPWPTVLLAYSLKSKEKLGVNKALQFLGDVFHTQNDEDTAVTLYMVALEGFTSMDVHQSRAECMLRLGDIFNGHGNLITAMGLWETARPLFVRSSQAKQAKAIDERLASVGENVRDQNRAN
jgi:tetratricopeptide (TPR) repeat protein